MNANFSNPLKPTWSMDIKYVKTKEGTLYFNWIKDFHSHAIIGSSYGTSMQYETIVKESLEKVFYNVKKYNINITNLIIHSDNGKQYYHQDFLKWMKKLNIKVSKKKPYKFGHNALSENSFYHLAVEWLPYHQYKTIKEAITDIKEYEEFYNYERIHSKFMDSPMNILLKLSGQNKAQ